MVTRKSKGIKILGWILAVLALNEFTTYIVGLYIGNHLGYLPEFLRNYVTLFSLSLYFINLSPLLPPHCLYELTDKGKAIFVDPCRAAGQVNEYFCKGVMTIADGQLIE